ncbi:hypothetical protein UlMin_040597 [Ulmus minor]
MATPNLESLSSNLLSPHILPSPLSPSCSSKEHPFTTTNKINTLYSSPSRIALQETQIAPSKPEPQQYTPLPPHQNHVISPLLFSYCRLLLRSISIAALILLASIIFIFWPSDPEVKIVCLRIKSLQIHTRPHVAIDLSIFMTVRVHNINIYSMDYSAMNVAVGYIGKILGHVRSGGGHMRAKGSSYEDVEMEFDGVEVFFDVMFLLEDLAECAIPFQTVTEPISCSNKLVTGHREVFPYNTINDQKV